MGEKSKLELEEELSEKPAAQKPSVLHIVCDTVWLAVTTVVLIGVYVVSALANDPNYGFKNSTGEISDKYYTQVCYTTFSLAIGDPSLVLSPFQLSNVSRRKAA